MDSFRGPWDGETKIVVGIDIGTTHTCVSFTLLDRDHMQVIHHITKWPGQVAQDLQSKVPTLVWYTNEKEAVAFGADAFLPETQEQVEDDGWFLAKHFKLHLYPEEMKYKHGMKPDPLPPGVSLLQVYSDFLGHIFEHVKSFFEDRMCGGVGIWERCYPMMTLAIARPNGWGDQEEAFLRSAAVAAGFTTQKAAPNKVHFMTEPEALACFFIHKLELWSAIQVGLNIIVYYCENTEAQINSYTVASIRPVLTLRELHCSTHLLGVGTGMLLASEALKRYIQTTLTEAGIDQTDVESYTSEGIKDFENARRRFSSNNTGTDHDADATSRDLSIFLGETRLNIPASGVRRGHMRLPAAKVKSFFEPCISEFKNFVGPIIRDMHVSFVFYSGEAANIPYLGQAFEQYCNPQGCQVLFPDWLGNSAILDGAIVRYILNSSNERRSQMSFGFETSVQFDHNLSEHRSHLVTWSPSGLKIIRGRWEEIACEYIPLEQNVTFTKSISLTFPTSNPEPSEFELTLYSYSGSEAPSWMRDKQGKLLGGFREWATISVDLTELSEVVESRIGTYGIISWHLEFDICLQFGEVGLSVDIQWKEEEEVQTTPARIIVHYTP